MVWTGKILRINLTTGKISTELTSMHSQNFLGGRGINVKILYDEVPAHLEPFDPENRVIFGVGPLIGTASPSSGRVTVTAKSPESGLYGECNLGGFWGPELKYAGYDHVVVQGRSEKPVYLWIKNEHIEIRDAKNVWGKDTWETQKIILDETGDPETKVISIGPAGEKLVRFANVRSDLKHAGGRTGIGAVMGSKLLKAVAVRGTRSLLPAKPEEFLEIVVEKHKKIKESPIFPLYSKLGGGLLGVINEDYQDYMDVVGAGNFEHTILHGLEKRFQGKYGETYGLKTCACFNCPVGCQTYVRNPGVEDDIAAQIACYSVISFTHRVKVTDPKVMHECVVLCNKYGMDTSSAADIISFMIDLFKKGLISMEHTDGIPLQWGDRDVIINLIHKIGKREGVGNFLAEGTARVAEKIGGRASDFAHHIRKLSLIAMDPRTVIGYGLECAVSARGDFSRGWPMVEYSGITAPGLASAGQTEVEEAKRLFGTEKVIYPNTYEGKPEATVFWENNIAAFDCAGMCKFIGRWGGVWLDENDLAELLTADTGVEISGSGLIKIAERVITLERAFNVREGVTRKDDTLPERFFKEQVADGRWKGQILDHEKFEAMKDRYYNLRGWNIETGIPSRKTLEKLNLRYIAEDLERLGVPTY